MYIHDDIKNDNINDKHIYLWSEQDKTNYELIDILSNIFNNKNEIKIKELKEIFEVLFKYELSLTKKDEEFTNIKEVYNIIVKNNIKKTYVPLEINYYDNDNNKKFIKSKPYDKIMNLNKKFVNEEGNYIPIYEFRQDNFYILKNK